MEETSIPNSPPVVAGWYPSGVPGEERWWDGGAWTAYTRPMAVGQASPGFFSSRKKPNKTGLLVMGIVSSVLLMPMGLYFLWALASGPIYALRASIPLVVLIGCAVFCFVMVARLSRTGSTPQ